MESGHLQEQAILDQRIVSAGNSSQGQRPSPCPNHFQDSTTARAVLATVLEIIKASGDNLNMEYFVPQQCPMLKCFHFSTTPMDQIRHVTACEEASKGEVRCLTCRRCHDFKRWHAVCSTLKSPAELFRRLSNKKRGSNTSESEAFATKRGKLAASDYSTGLSRQESHGVENVWREMEAPTNLFMSGVTASPSQLQADEHNSIHMPELGGSSATRPLPTPPPTRNPSGSEESQNLVAYGDAKVANAAEQPPPYVVSPQTTVDDYNRHHNLTDTIRLAIPPVQYIHESNFMESPENMEFSEANQIPWADPAVFHEAEDAHINLQSVPAVLDANVSAQYREPSEKSASIFSNSFPASRMPYQHRQKQYTWPMQTHRSSDTPRRSFDLQQHHIFDGVSELAEQDGSVANVGQHDTSTQPSVARQASFDTGAQDSITVNTLEYRHPQSTSRTSEGEPQAPVKRSVEEKQPRITRLQNHNNREYEECGRCGKQFAGAIKNRRQHLKRHVASKHTDVRYRCGHPGCSRSYNRADNLHDHEKRSHGSVMQAEVAELAAGDVDARHGGGQYQTVFTAAAAAAAAEVEGSAPDTGTQAPSAAELHFDVFRYSISTDDGQGWHPTIGQDNTQNLDARRIAGSIEENWDALMAGVSGGQHDVEEARIHDVRHGEADTPGEEEDGFSIGGIGLASRPLDLGCTSWRSLGEADGLSGAPTRGYARHT